jgi:hypothetical protein
VLGRRSATRAFDDVGSGRHGSAPKLALETVPLGIRQSGGDPVYVHDERVRSLKRTELSMIATHALNSEQLACRRKP